VTQIGQQWTVPQLSIMIIYNKTWSILIRWQSDRVYTTEIVLRVWAKPYHMNNVFQQMWAEIENLWNHALVTGTSTCMCSGYVELDRPCPENSWLVIPPLHIKPFSVCKTIVVIRANWNETGFVLWSWLEWLVCVSVKHSNFRKLNNVKTK